MQARTDVAETKPSYSNLLDTVKSIIKPFNLNINRCDVFEAFILEFAEVSATHRKCQFGRHPEQSDYCFFSLTVTDDKLDVLPENTPQEDREKLQLELNNACIKQLLKLNEKIPELQVAEIKPSVDEEVPSVLEDRPTFIVWMKVAAIITHILPAFEKYLHANNEFAKRYERYSFTSLQVWEDMQALCGQYEINHATHCLEELLCYFIKQNSERAAIQYNFLLSNGLNTHLIKMINDYAGTLKFAEEELNLLQDEGVHFNFDSFTDTHCVDIEAKSSTAELLNRFFNQIKPGGARVVTMQEEQEAKRTLTKVLVDCQVLLHPSLLSDRDDTLKQILPAFFEKHREKFKKLALEGMDDLDLTMKNFDTVMDLIIRHHE